MENTQNESEETEIFYDCRESQQIPLISSKGKFSERVIHHLKSLSNERYFEFENQVELVKLKDRRKLSEIYKPHIDLWNELFIKREGAKEKNSDVLTTESVQAINALLYFESVPVTAEPTTELLDREADDPYYFGAMQSGAWLGLLINCKSEFGCFDTLDEFRATQTRKPQIGFHLRPSDKAKRVYNFAFPYISSVKGYAVCEAFASVPAWHIVNLAYEIQSQLANHITKPPIITMVQA